ncbi:MAG: ribonuclease P protein component [Ignavibacteriales bacterium]
MLKRADRLRKPADFKAVYRQGRVFSGDLLRLYALPCGKGRKAGVVASKKIGGAVARNRLRRLVREAVRAVYPLLSDGVHLVFVGRKGAREASFRDVSAEVRGLLERAGILAGRERGGHG